MENQKTKEQEERFIAWTLARDDDWWEEGHGHFSIWDFRIIQEFFKEEITNALNQQRLQIVGEIRRMRMKQNNSADYTAIAYNKALDEFLTKLEK